MKAYANTAITMRHSSATAAEIEFYQGTNILMKAQAYALTAMRIITDGASPAAALCKTMTFSGTMREPIAVTAVRMMTTANISMTITTSRHPFFTSVVMKRMYAIMELNWR